MNKVELIRKIVVYSVYILFLTCFQVSFPDKLSLNGQIADLMFVFVVLVAYMFGIKDGIIIGLIVGILRDCFAAPAVIGLTGSVVSSVGIGAFLLFSVAVFSASVFTIKIKRKPAFALLTLISVTALYKIFGHGIIFIWTRVFSKTLYHLSAKELFIDSIFTQIFLNILAAIPIYLLLRFVGPYKKGQNPMLSAQEGRGADSSWLTI
ncbi:MAG: hypothetical protein K6G47_04885 [Clostridia bacterium]|nr:hypothetical protein [Clostridia bacterium]